MRNEVVGGMVGEGLDAVGKSIKDGIVNGFISLIKFVFDFFDPIIYWGCQIIILYCIIIFFVSREKKPIAVAMKTFLFFVTFLYLRSALT